jgi:branched-subunit amino acid aminotransferase/4-amino-4-deoxychorismate lyase
MDVVGLIETIRFERGRALFLKEHESRLRAAWQDVFEGPAPLLARTAAAAIARAGMERGLARVEFARSADGRPTRTAAARALASVPRRIAVAVARAPRREPAAARRLKSADRRWVDRLVEADAFETLVWDDASGLLEGTRTNLFLVRARDDELVTPPVACGLVPGVIRAAVFAAAPRIGLRVVERVVAPADLEASDGLLLTGVGVGVVAAGECDGRPLPVAAAEPLARRLWRTIRGE